MSFEQNLDLGLLFHRIRDKNTNNRRETEVHDYNLERSNLEWLEVEFPFGLLFKRKTNIKCG